MNAKRSIAISCLSIALCASLLSGATFALYSSKDEVKATVTSGGVNVQAEVTGVAAFYTNESEYAAGTVSGSKVEGWSGTFAPGEEGNYGSFTYNAGGLTLTNFAPGDKIVLTMDIVNYSTISMKYQMQVLATSGWLNSGLATQLDVSIDNKQIELGSHGTYYSAWSDRVDPKADPETLKTVTVEIALPVDSTAEGSCELSISVNAVQGNIYTSHIVNNYQQLVDAIEAATGGERITIGSDLEVPEALEITADIELDLNGYTISNSEGGHTISVVNNSKLTISGGTVSNSISGKSALYVEAGSEAVINGGTFSRTNSDDSNYYTIENYGTMTINDGTFTCTNGILTGTITLVANKVGGTMEINGGEFSGMITAIKNESSEENALVINGGTFTTLNGTSSNMGQALQNQGVAIIRGGTFGTENPSSTTYEGLIYNLSQLSTSGTTELVGNLTIEGGTFNNKVRCDNLGTTNGTPAITITGGDFKNNVQIGTADANIKIEGGYFDKTFTASTVKGTLEIVGGRFKTIPDLKYFADGYVADPMPDESGAYGLKKGNASVMYSTSSMTAPSIGFASVNDLLNYTVSKNQKSAVVMLLGDWSESFSIPAGYTIYLYLCGYTLSNTAGEHTITVNGTVMVASSYKYLDATGATKADSNPQGTVENTSGKAALYIAEGGKATLRSFTFTGNGESVIENHGTLTFNTKATTVNGNVLNADGGVVTVSAVTVNGNMVNRGTASVKAGTINGAVVTEEGGTTTITGGTFANEPAASDIAEGYESVLGEDGKWSVVAK